jgi:polyisoprenoid-binding protein YceI
MAGTSSASFTSDALLETIQGTTSGLSGSISVDLAAPSSATGTISFAASGLRTGNDMRDEHLHSDDWLGSGDITFTISSIATDAAQLAHGATAAATVAGTLTIKGLSQDVSVPASVTYYEIENPQVAGTAYIENNLLRVTTAFDIQLSDFGINVPAPLQNKLSNTLTLDVRVTAQQQ